MTTPAPADLLPSWGGFDRPGASAPTASTAEDGFRQETRLADARGWPMPALSSVRVLPPAPAVATSMAFPSSSLAPGPGPMAGGSTYFPLSGSLTTGYAVTAYSTASLAVNLPPPPMPLRPVWPGFLVDVLCFAVALALLRWVAFTPGRFLREVSRMRSGRCIACGYDLGYDFLRGCPECGWRRSAGAPGLAGTFLPREGEAALDQPAHRGANGSPLA